MFNFCRPFVNRLLIEKPDFYKSKEVGWALLTLYSLYFDATVHSEPQLELFIFDALAKEFDALSELIKDRTSVEDIREIYVEADRDKANRRHRGCDTREKDEICLSATQRARRRSTQNFAANTSSEGDTSDKWSD